MRKLANLSFLIAVIASAYLIFSIALVIVSPEEVVIPKLEYRFISALDKQISKMTLRQKITSLMILHKPSANANELKAYLDQYQPSGLIFMGDNIPTDENVLIEITKTLQENAAYPYLLAVDQEGGTVSRLGADTYPSALNLKFENSNNTNQAFLDRSNLIHNYGLNLNFGIVADITDDTNSFIYHRTFGGNPSDASLHVESAVNASKSKTLSTLKHFPGHGESDADSHNSLPTTGITYDEWTKRDMPPFKIGIDAGADFVMFGHLIYSEVDEKPASLSDKWHDILTKDLGFNGISITDDMAMLHNSGLIEYQDHSNNAISAINAGNDILLYVLDSNNSIYGTTIGEIIGDIELAVNNNQIDIIKINQNVKKILKLRQSLATILQ